MNKNIEHKIKFQWVKQDTNLWLGVVEISGEYGMETYRIKIEEQIIDTYNFFHYKFQRFDFKNREWTMEQIQSYYAITFFKTLEEKYIEHIEKTKPENIFISFKAIDKNRERRMKIYRYFCKKLEKQGYLYFENKQPTFSILMCIKNIELIAMYKTQILDNYLDNALQKFEYYN